MCGKKASLQSANLPAQCVPFDNCRREPEAIHVLRTYVGLEDQREKLDRNRPPLLQLKSKSYQYGPAVLHR